jgi:hypothetical protein
MFVAAKVRDLTKGAPGGCGWAPAAVGGPVVHGSDAL